MAWPWHGRSRRSKVLTVSPFHALEFEPGMVTDTRGEYEKELAASAKSILTQQVRLPPPRV